MRTIDVDLFEHLFEECIDEVASSSEPIVIARDGRPIARIEPIVRKQAPKSLWALHKGQIEILGDIIAPVDVEWEVDG
jgi:antitoxin (DNA-binding transcriptional repressor) of toxin-antitoxin stability system